LVPYQYWNTRGNSSILKKFGVVILKEKAPVSFSF